MHGQLQSGAICLNFGLKLYLHLSLCVRAVKALAMLRTSTGTSLTNMHGQLQSGARCLIFGLKLYLHLSLCLRAVKALAMLRKSTGTSLTNMHGQLQSGARCLNFGLKLFSVPFLEFVSSDGYGDAAHKRMCV